jgi:hypothetical protein
MSKDAPNGQREPVPIANIKFLTNGGAQGQSGPHDSGMGAVPSALVSKHVDERKEHAIDWLPWARQYRITHVANKVSFRIHEHRVDYAVTLEEWQEAERAAKARKESR